MSQILAHTVLALLTVAYVYALYRTMFDSARERQELRRQALLALPAKRCHRCGGEFEAWHGRLDPMRGCIDYLPGAKSFVKYEFTVPCAACRVPSTFRVWTDGKLTNRDQELRLQ
jgi:hypothetical protein